MQSKESSNIDGQKPLFEKTKEFPYDKIKTLYFESNDTPVMGLTVEG